MPEPYRHPHHCPQWEQEFKPSQEWFWSAAWQQAEKEAEADLKAGRLETFDTMEEFLADLD